MNTRIRIRIRIRSLVLGTSAIALLAIGTAPAAAQPTPSPSARDYDARIRDQARRGTLTPPPPEYDAEGNRIIQEGPAWARNSNNAQRERVSDALRDTVAEPARQVQRDIPNVNTQLNNRIFELQRGFEGIAPVFDPNANRNGVGPSREEIMNDPNYARNLSRSMIGGIDQVLAVDQDLSQTIRPTLGAFAERTPQLIGTLRDVARENGASAAELRELDEAVRAGQAMPTRVTRALDQNDYAVRDARRRIDENRQRYEDALTPAVQILIDRYGPDPARWPADALPRAVNQAVPNLPPTRNIDAAGTLGVNTSGIRRTAGQATGGVYGGPQPAATPTPPAPGRTAGGPAGNGGPSATGPSGPNGTTTGSGSSRSTTSGSRTVSRGNGAGTQGDLSAGPRVPRSQGGTGAETPASRQAAQQQANQRAADQARAQERQRAEAQAARTERLRQAAMDQARREDRGESNDPLDNLGRRRQPNETPPPGGRPGWDVPNVGQPPPSQSGEGGSDALGAAAVALANAARAAGQEGPGGTRRYDDRRPGESEMQYRRRHSGLGRVGGGPTGGSGSGGDAWFDYLRNAAGPAPTAEEIAAAEAARRREAARLADERARLARAAENRTNRDANWNAMVAGRFDSNRMWAEFANNGGTLTVLELEAIYRDYDLNRSSVIPPARSLSSAPNSLSSMFNTRLSSAGTPVRSGTDDYNDPAVQSLYEALYGLTQRRRGPLGPTEAEIQTANMGDYDLYSDPDGRWGRETGGYVAASLFSEELDYLSRSFVNGRNGLQGLLAQPFNVLLTWGQSGNDLDLHMTGPTGLGSTDRFHIYYAATGNLQSFPFAALIRDCICRSGSEVILTSNLLGGGVYRVSVFNFGDQSANSNNLANASEARIQIVRGGVAVAQGNGTTIQGGRLILDTRVPVGPAGNTWVAVELDPRTGRITVPARIVQSEGSANVR